LLLRPEDVIPSHPDWEVIGVFNPGVVRYGETTIILARVAERPREQRPGWTAHPRWSPEQGFVVDWVENEHLSFRDTRVVEHVHTGLVRLTFISHLRIFFSHDGRTVKNACGPSLLPANEMEEFGLEDPRITPIDGRYYITYVAVSRHGPAMALASTTDFQVFRRHGIIFCPENKDVMLFPQRVGGKYVALHRPLGYMPFCRPEMWLARSDDLVHWGRHQFLFSGVGDWEDGRVGGGTPPISVAGGWLEIYHGNRRPTSPGEVGAYCAGAMLLAKEDPARVLGTSTRPIVEPQLDFEIEGFVNQVVFPTGVVEEGERVLVYYGASDKYCAMVELLRDDVLQSIS
jgi:predicted GH43/DUF377 family glycosyl hydrolase